jgi:hypothetical protein
MTAAAGSVGGRERLHAAPERAVFFPLFAAACGLALLTGYWTRDDLPLSPESGLGYALGVAGLGAMVALLTYSVRKRVRVLQTWGPLRRWFGVHMLLGVAGPAAILFHAGFRVGSINAAIALVAMLLVAASGFVGRFLYTRVHFGLFGHRESLRELARRADSSRSSLHSALEASPAVVAGVRAFEAEALAPVRGPLTGFARVVLLGHRTRAVERRARKLLRPATPPGAGVRAAARAAGRSHDVFAALAEHLALVRRVAGFSFYERCLALWHAVHLPLCTVLFTAAAVHVIAVHLY